MITIRSAITEHHNLCVSSTQHDRHNKMPFLPTQHSPKDFLMEERCVFCAVRAATVYSYTQKINIGRKKTEFSPDAFCMRPNTGLLKDILNKLQHSYVSSVCALLVHGVSSCASLHVTCSLCTVLMKKHCLCNWQNSMKLYLVISNSFLISGQWKNCLNC